MLVSGSQSINCHAALNRHKSEAFKSIQPSALHVDHRSTIKEDVRAAIDDSEREATLPELLDALWQNKVPMREDDVLMPGVHFQPREYPDRDSL